MKHEQLRERHRQYREYNPEGLNLRLHRPVSWLCRADEVMRDDPDAGFIFTWISFNAAYAQDVEEQNRGERFVFKSFFDDLVLLDIRKHIHNEIWMQFEGVVTELLDNQYIFNPFWRYHNGDDSFHDWDDRFDSAKRAANFAMKEQDTAKILSILFDRLPSKIPSEKQCQVLLEVLDKVENEGMVV